LSIRIVTPTRVAFESEADKVYGPAAFGEFGLLEDHANLVTLSKPGVITVFLGPDETKFFVGKGFAEANDNHTTYLVDLCEKVEEIDKEAAQKDLEAAEAAIEGLSPLDSGYQPLQDRIDLANARLEA
jgi:F-type H+-transporting ATPase subunit epsilon